MRKAGLKKIDSLFIIALCLCAILLLITISVISKNISGKPNTGKFISQKMEYCYQNGQKSDCYKQAAKEFLNYFSLKEILVVFAENETRPEFFSNCHLTAHYLGREAYFKLGSVQKVFSQSSRSCLGGTYHGAVEGYFIDKKITYNGENDLEIAPHVSNLCGKKKDYNRAQDFIECNHGMGHALMYLTQDDLLRTLKLCDFLGTNEERELCYTGAYMQNADNGTNPEHPSKYYKADDPIYPCQILEEKYLYQCYTYYSLSRFQNDYLKSTEICSTVPKKYQAGCFNTYGRDRTMVTADINELDNLCKTPKEPDMRLECIRGAAYNLIVRFDYTNSKGYDFCKILETDSQETCAKEIRRAISNVIGDAQKAREYCRNFNDNRLTQICEKS